jgi:hypothetical protein
MTTALLGLEGYWTGLIGLGVLAVIGMAIYSAFKLRNTDPWGDDQ